MVSELSDRIFDDVRFNRLKIYISSVSGALDNNFTDPSILNRRKENAKNHKRAHFKNGQRSIAQWLAFEIIDQHATARAADVQNCKETSKKISPQLSWINRFSFLFICDLNSTLFRWNLFQFLCLQKVKKWF